MSTLKSDASRTSSDLNISGKRSLSDRLSDNIEELKSLQTDPGTNPENRAVREPEHDMFEKFPSCTIILPIIDKPLEYCMVLLHDKGQNEDSLKDLARRLQQRLKECVYILLQAPTKTIVGHSWSSSDLNQDLIDDYFWSSRYVLESIILKRLIQTCYFRPRNIVILGHGQGGIVALKAASIWNDVELGGIIAVGSLPVKEQLSASKNVKTPVLMVKSVAGHIRSQDVEFLRGIFSFVDSKDRTVGDKEPPTGQEKTGLDNELKPYIDFLVHRLRRDEWKKQDILSFDGGGIRGYGSLLMLKALMEKIANEEKIQDGSVKSSFHPCPFRPIRSTAEDRGEVDDSVRHVSRKPRTDSNTIVADNYENYPSESARFLPCHYFTYGAGTSTGGLISIMLFRLRMTVEECIEEYKALAGKVFGRPRPPVINKIRPKFDEKYLEDAIKDVCRRRGETINFGELSYTPPETSENDLFRCMVLAISYQGVSRSLYHFRTYSTPDPQKAMSKGATAAQGSRRYGKPSRLAVWEVARATSAAPRYFAPIEIKGGDGRTTHVFKDGGFGHNNPTQEMYTDVVYKHEERNIGLIVSIGTGETELKFETAKNHIGDTLSNLKVAIKLPAMTGPVHKTMEDLCKDNKKFNYCRLDGGKELGKLAMDEWESHKFTGLTKKNREPGNKTLEKIETAILSFLEEDRVKAVIADLAKQVVERRRLRVRDASEWDRFASCSYYSCESQWPQCKQTRLRTADDFRDHIGKKHQVTMEANVLDSLREGRRHDWIYPPRGVVAP